MDIFSEFGRIAVRGSEGYSCFSSGRLLQYAKWGMAGWICALAIFLGSVPTAEAVPSPEQLYQNARDDFYALMNSKAKQALRHNWTNCIDKFLKVYSHYPDHPNAYKAVFTSGKLYQKLFLSARNPGDLNQALGSYKKLVNEFPAGSLTDDALYHQGELYEETKDFSSAAAVLEKLLSDYPRGDQVTRAQALMRSIEKDYPRENQAAKSQTMVRKLEEVAEGLPVSVSATLEKINFSESKEFARLIVQTSKPVKYSYGRLANPDRIFINLVGVRLAEELPPLLEISHENIERVRIAQFDEVTSRLVVDLKNSKNLKMTPASQEGRLVLEFSGLNAKPAVLPKPIIVAKEVPVPSPMPRSVKRKVPLVVIDAGHGGKDFGAQSVNGLLEKELNLDVSMKLKKILETRYKYQVMMTRDDDTFIPLDERGDVANAKEADIFVSIHANAAPRRVAHGIETYYLGIANGEQAQATAARENGELVHSVKDDQVQQILASLISTTKINDSSRLAGRVQENLFSTMKEKYSEVKDLGVKEGPFFVLHDTNMPSILVEIGFITNPREETRLRELMYLNRLADSIARGIHRYLIDRGPTI